MPPIRLLMLLMVSTLSSRSQPVRSPSQRLSPQHQPNSLPPLQPVYSPRRSLPLNPLNTLHRNHLWRRLRSTRLHDRSVTFNNRLWLIIIRQSYHTLHWYRLIINRFTLTNLITMPQPSSRTVHWHITLRPPPSFTIKPLPLSVHPASSSSSSVKSQTFPIMILTFPTHLK